ncbi:hypothetical protein G7Y89_g2384 [Cudoniella acicularis]|uniref:Putative gamma-glutamylcyclotransferase n=1 Tax=Cudoniella acicularis TaxID=354080 RepID=A0A8H4W6J4_9HELO|nr:hypothetical protein G7Y89_g2384 [Cudoniella acicularis]
MPPGFNPRQTIPKEIYVAAMGMKLQKLPKPDPFTPCHMFFYGSLMDTEVLQSVLGLPDRPAIVKGEIKGFSMKMWGIYPTIIRSEEGKISGTVWKVDSESEFLRLQDYETDAYTWCLCDIEQEDGAVLHGCRTFCWAGDANSRDLSDGSFDLARYQKYFKASVIRK